MAVSKGQYPAVSRAAVSKALEKRAQAFQDEFEKSMGAGTLRRGVKKRKYETISTGSIVLDVATGVGGYVRGRIAQLHGPQDLGKTTLALAACAEAQRANPEQMVAYIDVENKMDEAWADAWGVDRSRWFLHVPHTAEDTADAVKKCMQAGIKEGKPLFSLIVVDSVGAMIGRVEMEKNADEDTVAIVARIVTRMVKYATSFLEQNNAAMVIINQVRANISTTGFGPKTELPGGWALKHCTTLGLQVRGTDKQAPAATLGGERIPVGRYTAVKVERNKVAPAGRVATILLNTVATGKNPVGIDKPDEAFQVGDKLDIILRSGSNYTLPDGSRHNGQEKTIKYLREHPEVVEEIRKRAIAMHEAELVDDAGPEINEEDIPEQERPLEADAETGEVIQAAPQPVQEAKESGPEEEPSDSYMEL